jgi:hypothetical protein
LRWIILLLTITLVMVALYSVTVLAEDAPKIPHGTAGFETCLNCHGANGLKPAPADHASYTQTMCLGCHSYAPLATPQAALSGNAYCLSCHGQPGLSMTLGDGEKLSLYIDANVLNNSVHGNKLLCTDCHTSISGFPHPSLTATSTREFSISQYEVCKKCHFEEYTKTLDGIHYQAFSQGNLQAPLCTDCHGAHDISQPDQPRSKISTTCSKCHPDIYAQYIQSVHGKALLDDNNADVPVCTDCHQAHTIADPTTPAFRIQSVEICSNCHSNAKLMQKYNISTNVVQSYLQDFHGATVALIGKQSKDIWASTAVCTDCHGVHDIKAVTDPNSPVIKANLLATCQKCHPDANANFSGAWLSHYEPSLNKAPMVFLVQWFYRLMIPFILVGLSAHILLDLWRAITNR